MPPTKGDGELEGFRDYLKVLCWKWIPIDLRDRIDPSDLIQETLLRAHRERDAFRGHSAAEKACWLRQILAHLMSDVFRELKRPKMIPHADLERSSFNMAQLYVADQSTPSTGLLREERAVLIAGLLARLPPDQAEAIVLKHCEGWPVEAIGRHMNRSPQAIGGLLKRGLRALRALIVTREFQGLGSRSQ
jgi:RNA polymerase sigma-70 factor (ECF subfamily)